MKAHLLTIAFKSASLQREYSFICFLLPGRQLSENLAELLTVHNGSLTAEAEMKTVSPVTQESPIDTLQHVGGLMAGPRRQLPLKLKPISLAMLLKLSGEKPNIKSKL